MAWGSSSKVGLFELVLFLAMTIGMLEMAHETSRQLTVNELTSMWPTMQYWLTQKNMWPAWNLCKHVTIFHLFNVINVPFFNEFELII